MESNQSHVDDMQMKLLHNSTNTKKWTRIKHPNSFNDGTESLQKQTKEIILIRSTD